MKPDISHLTTFNTLSFSRSRDLFHLKGPFYVLLLLVVTLAAGCFRKFYNTGTTTKIDSTKINQLKAAQKYFIVHYKDSVLAIDGIQISDNILLAQSRPLLNYHTLCLNPKPGKPNPFPGKLNGDVLSEVHLYVNANSPAEKVSVRIPLSDVYSMDIYEFDKTRTNTSTYLSVGGIVVTVGIISVAFAAAVAAMTFSVM